MAHQPRTLSGPRGINERSVKTPNEERWLKSRNKGNDSCQSIFSELSENLDYPLGDDVGRRQAEQRDEIREI